MAGFKDLIGAHDPTAGSLTCASRLAPKGDDGRFDLCVAMNGCGDWRGLYFDSSPVSYATTDRRPSYSAGR
jgi:hypothetical protein